MRGFDHLDNPLPRTSGGERLEPAARGASLCAMRWLGLAFLTTGLVFGARSSVAEEGSPSASDESAGEPGGRDDASSVAGTGADADATGAQKGSESTATAEAAAPPRPAPAAPTPHREAPPTYYVEPQAPTNPSYGARAYEPPLPPMMYYEPPPPPRRVTPNAPPKSAFWLGARAGLFVPFGSLWLDGADYGGGLFYRHRSFADYASSGPTGELDVGARLGRRYNLFGLWEHASLGAGSLDDHAFGGQMRGSTDLYGIGLRFSTDPGSTGFLLEFALGYRDFHAHWADGTTLSLGNAFDARIGLGADIRMSRWFALSPMVILGGGSFSHARWSGPAGNQDAFGPLDQPGQYGTFELALGAHADIF